MPQPIALPYRTMQDHFRALVNRPDLYHRLVVKASPVENHVVRCSCGRRTAADMMRDTRDVPRTITPEDFLCDGCLERLVGEGHVPRAELAGYLARNAHAVEPALPALPAPPSHPLPNPANVHAR